MVNGSPESDESTKGCVLIVDDEVIVRKYLTKVIAGMDYKVIACENGAEGVAAFEQHHQEIGLVMLDMVMPKMDGHTAFLELRKISPDVPVVVASGYAVDDMIDDCMALGAVEFLRKPFDIEDLRRAIRTHVRSN